MKLWLDDLRLPPEGWEWVKSVEDCISALKTGQVEMLSLDNDLGLEFNDNGEFLMAAEAVAPEGYLVVDWMVENNVWPDWVSLHTSNVVARNYMRKLLEKHGGYAGMQHINFTPRNNTKKRQDLVYPAIAFYR